MTWYVSLMLLMRDFLIAKGGTTSAVTLMLEPDERTGLGLSSDCAADLADLAFWRPLRLELSGAALAAASG